MNKELHYHDVLLLPNEGIVDSRSSVDTTIALNGFKFQLPIVPANMKTIIDFNLAKWLCQNNYFYIMHRFGIDTIEFVEQIKEFGPISISIGVNEDSKEIIKKLYIKKLKPHFITIDIAHGHSFKMKHMLQFIKAYFPDTFVIAGNVCTAEGTEALNDWGADSVKIGVGPGRVCLTKLQTGFSRPQFTAVLECAKISKVPVIADGGVLESGDIAKALVAGAKIVMVGSILAAYEESPGKKIIYSDGRIVKEYFGSASEDNKGAKEYVEGRKIEIPFRGSIVDKFKEISQSLRSSISYAGGKDLNAFHKVKWVIQ